MSSFRSLFRAQARLTTTPSKLARPFLATRTYHATFISQLPYKDDQDRTSLKPKSTEGSKSGTDDAAAQTDVAFDPSKTSPEEETAAAKHEEKTKSNDSGGGGTGNPLDVSGGSHKESKPLGDEGGAEMKGTVHGTREKASGGGSPEKKGKPPVA